MERAIKDLCQLSDDAFFDEVATGIGYVIDSVSGLDTAAHTLSKSGQKHPALVLGNLAEEEAAKVLILMDSVRCPRKRQKEKSRTLGYFYDHLAKGIYVDVCRWSPLDYQEVMRNVELERKSHYLDGPHDVDWIFPNDITQRRVDDLYVGYLRADSREDKQGYCYWNAPAKMEIGLGYYTSNIVHLIQALHAVQVTTPEGLSVIAEIWRPVTVRPQMQSREVQSLNRQTLDELASRNILGCASTEAQAHVIDLWPFPLWPLDLNKRDVNKEELRKTQQEHHYQDW